MTRAMPLTLTSSLMMLASACSPPDSSSLEPTDDVDAIDVPVLNDPADPAPEQPPASRPLSQDDRDALANILSELPMGGDVEFGGIDELGTITLTSTTAPGSATVSVMDGIAFQSLQTFGSQSFDFTVLVAFDGLDAQAQTVDDLMFAFAPIVDPGVVSVAGEPEFDEAFAVYADALNDMTYFGQSGDFTITAITLDPTTQVDPCADAGTLSCPTVEGTFQGTLDMSTLGFAGVVEISNSGLPSGTGTPLDVFAQIDVPLGRTTFVQ